ncbi:MAG: hypothetical protein ABIJ31_11365 [Pseudomonadota bacterium]
MFKQIKTAFLLLTHRRSALKYCDRIVALRNGRVTTFGIPQCLMNENTQFQGLVLP